MMLIGYDKAKKEAWDEFVLSNPHAWTGHMSAIFELEKETANAHNRSVMVVDNQNNILCILPLFETSQKELRFIPTRILCSGTHLRSGPLFDPELSQRQCKDILSFLMDNVTQIAKKLRIDKIIIGYPVIIGEETSLSHYGYLPLKHYGYKEQNVVSMIIDLNADIDTLFRSLKQTCRTSIKKCQKEGGRISKSRIVCNGLSVTT